MQVKHKLGAEDVERITQHAAAAAQAALHQAVQTATDKDRSLAGASRYRYGFQNPTHRMLPYCIFGGSIKVSVYSTAALLGSTSTGSAADMTFVLEWHSLDLLRSF